MVEQDRADRAVVLQVVLAGRVVAVPGDHIERAVPDRGAVELAAPLHGDRRRHLAVLERRHRGLEVAAVGHAVGADRATPRQLELLAVVLAHEAACRAFQDLDPVDQAARDQRDLLRGQVDDAELGAEPQLAFLRHHQQLAVGRVEVLVDHRGGDQVDVARHADLGVDVAGRGHGPHAGQPGQFLAGMRHRAPAVLAERDHVRIDVRRRAPVRQVDLGEAVGVLHRRPDPVAPSAFVLVARRGEGGARELLAVQTVVALLRAVHALRQGAGQGLGLEVVTEPRHVAGSTGGGRGPFRRSDRYLLCAHGIRPFPSNLALGQSADLIRLVAPAAEGRISLASSPGVS